MSATPTERWRQRLHDTFGPAASPTSAAERAARQAERLERAEALRAQSRRREAIFGAELFAEPAFDLLLDLYLAEHGKPADRSKPGASWRYFAAMEDRGLIERARDEDEPRRARLRLTAEATEALEQYIDAI